MRVVSLAAVTLAASIGCSASDAAPMGGGTAGSNSSTQEGGAAGVSSASSGGQGGSSAGTSSSAGGASTGGMTGTAGQPGADAAVVGTGGASNDSGVAVIDATPFDGNAPNMVPAGYTGTPFGGAPQIIPGKIEVERYDLGGNGVAFQNNVSRAFNKCGLNRTDAAELDCTDNRDKNAQGCGTETPGEVYLGYIGAGEWYKYTVVVTEPGRYVISGHEGVATNNAKVSFSFTQDTKTDAPLPSTVGCGGWEAYHVWGTASSIGSIDLIPGKYVMTLTMVSVGMNLDWFAFTKM